MRPLTLRLRPARRRTAPRRARRGFTIVEAIVAIVMLAAGVLALVSSSVIVTKEMTAASQRAIAGSLAAQRMEMFRSFNQCTRLRDSTTVTRGMTEQWWNEAAATGGGQQSRRMKYRITYRDGRVQRIDSMTTYIPCN